MPEKDEYLKSKNTPIIITYIIWCFTLYIVFQNVTGSIWENIQNVFITLNAKDGLLIILSPILSLVLTGILSSSLKAKIIFWKTKNALPGHRVFTKLMYNDHRIDIDKLKSKTSNLPNDPEKQNILWYSIYKKYSEKVTVKQSHKNFLLSRDISIISLLFAFIGTIGYILMKISFSQIVLFVSIMILQHIIFLIVARNHGNRMVCNVIVEYLSEDI